MKKSSEPENPREFWNAYRPFLHSKTNQANDIIIKENDVVMSDKREIAKIFNVHFIQIADDVPLVKETDYGQHFENHPSIKAIHEKNSATDYGQHFENHPSIKAIHEKNSATDAPLLILNTSIKHK